MPQNLIYGLFTWLFSREANQIRPIKCWCDQWITFSIYIYIKGNSTECWCVVEITAGFYLDRWSQRMHPKMYTYLRTFWANTLALTFLCNRSCMGRNLQFDQHSFRISNWSWYHQPPYHECCNFDQDDLHEFFKVCILLSFEPWNKHLSFAWLATLESLVQTTVKLCFFKQVDSTSIFQRRGRFVIIMKELACWLKEARSFTAILKVQYIPRNMHTVLLCFALLWLCNRS